MHAKVETGGRGYSLFLLAFLLIWGGASAKARNQPSTSISAPATEYQCVQRGPHSKVWRRTLVQTNQAGIVRTNLHSYTELATGLCYLQNGQYVDSAEQINAVADGAEAVQGRHRVHWAANANTPSGAVHLTTPDDKHFHSTVYGLVYYDSSSGSNVLLTQLQDCAATISSNTLTYGNAFSNLTADLRYTYRKSGLSQDVILTQQPPAPEAYGMNPATTWLQVITEFFDPPAPAVRTATNNGLPDMRQLGFGDMRIGLGHAFLFNGDPGVIEGVPVAKNWTNFDNRTFLIEQVPYSSVSNILSTLHSSTIKPDRTRVRRTVLLEPKKPRKVSAAKPVQPVKIAKVMPQEKGLMLDYVMLSGGSNYMTFQGDTTYYISDYFSVDHECDFEGGVVVKYTNSPYAVIDDSSGDGGIGMVFKTSPYRPSIFTSANDDTVGDRIDGSTGTPSTNGLATYLNTGYDTLFQGVRFSYAGTAVSTGNTGEEYFQDCQFIKCQTNTLSLAYGGAYSFKNVLISHCATLLMAEATDVDLDCENMTLDSCGSLLTTLDVGSIQVAFTNSILTGVGGDLTPYTFDHTTVATDGSGIYQTVGAGSYYLVNGSTNRNAGTTDIDTNLLADLQGKTTYPPVVFPFGWFTNSYTFFPQAQRDTTGSTVDLGYHYDPLDYVIDIVMTNATANVLSGTALATAGPYNYGVELYAGATFNCSGTATSPNYMVRYNTVQEQSNTNWETTSWGGSLETTWDSGFAPSTANFRFTEWSVLGGGDGQVLDDFGDPELLTFQDCQFYGGTINTYDSTSAFTNCLFYRVDSLFGDALGAYTVSNIFCNDLFVGGEFDNNHTIGSGIWTVRDSLFDQTQLFSDVYTLEVDVCSNNGYVTTNFGVMLPSNNDQILPNSPAYEVGTLGDYYYPSNQTNLIHQGSRLAADAGLYHYTVTTNNVIEGTNIVSIGFHYVATDTNGVPISTPDDGIPDYLADSNGNGIYDVGIDLANWQVYTSLNGLTASSGLVVFTPLQ